MASGENDDGAEDDEIPALFATIHFRSERRPDGYTDEEIAELNGGQTGLRSLRPRTPARTA